MRVNQHDKDNSTAFLMTRSGQSALEYMMTYGWAILIIVIVAVILYSMGIFSPSSSITTSSSGFSPFIVSSAVCSQAGLSIAVTAGGLPNNAVSATLSRIFIQSNTGTTAMTGKEYNITPVTLASGHSTVITVPGVACISTGIKFSLSSKLQYSYSTAVGSVAANATGTIAGTTSSPSITNYVPLTITSSTATPSPFQQMIIVNMNTYSSYASSNLENIEFTYPNGTIIPSWRENGTSNAQTVVYWLKLGSFTSLTVHMDFFPTGDNVLNPVNTGEAPQLSGTYAQYDNGVNVFNYYTNFAGTSLPSGWTETHYQSGNSYTVSNGIMISAQSSTSMALQNNNSYNPQTDILETFGYAENQGFGGWGYTLEGGYPSATSGSIVILVDTPIGGYYLVRASGNTETSMGVAIGTTPYVFSVWETTSEMYGQIDYQHQTTTSIGFVSETSLYPGIALAQRSGTDYLFSQWMRTRAYPPNGVMPSIAFGSVS